MSPSTNSGAEASPPPAVADGGSPPVSGVRERILAVGYELFSRRGVRDVGVNELITRSGVAKASFYRHFASKDELVLAFLERRDRQWTVDAIVGEARRRADTPEQQLLAIFDVFADWFARDDFEACSFINILLETGDRRNPIGAATTMHLENIRSVVRALAEEAKLREPEAFAHSWHILMKGSIVAAGEGDTEAAKRAQKMARLLIDQYR